MKRLMVVFCVAVFCVTFADAKPKRTQTIGVDLAIENKAEPDENGWSMMSVPDRRAMLVLIHLFKVEYPGLTKEQLMTKLVQINAEAKKNWADIDWNVVLP